jgi:adenosylcobinamide-GDP ribazoletransferase
VPAPVAGVNGGAAFGLVGTLVGMAGAIPILLVGERAPIAAGALAAGALAIVSGALHLDGLADTADALAAPTAQAAERARRDPRVGAAGAVAIGMAVVIDASLLASIITLAGAGVAGLTCVVAAAGSRAVAPAAAWLARVARSSERREAGLGGWFVGRATAAAAAVAIGSTLLVAIAAWASSGQPALIVGLVAGTAVGLAVAGWLIRVRGTLDGDGFGFLVEIVFAAILLATVVAL